MKQSDLRAAAYHYGAKNPGQVAAAIQTVVYHGTPALDALRDLARARPDLFYSEAKNDKRIRL